MQMSVRFPSGWKTISRKIEKENREPSHVLTHLFLRIKHHQEEKSRRQWWRDDISFCESYFSFLTTQTTKSSFFLSQLTLISVSSSSVAASPLLSSSRNNAAKPQLIRKRSSERKTEKILSNTPIETGLERPELTDGRETETSKKEGEKDD